METKVISLYQNNEISATPDTSARPRENVKDIHALTLKNIAEMTASIQNTQLRKLRTTQLVSEWLNFYQFELDGKIYIGRELSTEKIIFCEEDKIERFSDIDILKSIFFNVGGIEPDLYILKKHYLPTCRIVFDTKSPRISIFSSNPVRFQINMYEKPKLRLIVEKKLSKAIGRIALDENYIDYLLSKYAPSIKEIIFNLFAIKEERLYFYNWLSFIVNTGEKTRNAVVLRGLQGTGKNSLADYVLSPFLGQKYCKTVSNDDLRSQFNGIFENALFVYFNEVRPDFRESSTVYEKLKALITDNTMLINEKNIKVREANNLLNSLFFTNNSVPLVIEESDRRYSIFTANVRLEDKFSKEEIKEIIDAIPGELINFWSIVMGIDFDRSLATKCYVNEAKKIIIQTTQEWAYLLADYLLKKDIQELIKFLSADMAVSRIPIFVIEETINDLKEEFRKGYISSKLLYKIYLLTHGITEEPSLIDTEKLRLFSRKKLSRKISTKLGSVKLKKEGEDYKYVWSIS